MQRDIVANLHEELSSTIESMQHDVESWQSQCSTLERQLAAAQAEVSTSQQEIKSRPTVQQVSSSNAGGCFLASRVSAPVLYACESNNVVKTAHIRRSWAQAEVSIHNQVTIIRSSRAAATWRVCGCDSSLRFWLCLDWM